MHRNGTTCHIIRHHAGLPATCHGIEAASPRCPSRIRNNISKPLAVKRDSFRQSHFIIDISCGVQERRRHYDAYTASATRRKYLSEVLMTVKMPPGRAFRDVPARWPISLPVRDGFFAIESKPAIRRLFKEAGLTLFRYGRRCHITPAASPRWRKSCQRTILTERYQAIASSGRAEPMPVRLLASLYIYNHDDAPESKRAEISYLAWFRYFYRRSVVSQHVKSDRRIAARTPKCRR